MQSKVSALPMDSGFIPNPPGIKQITGLLIDGERADFERNGLGVWPILEDGDTRTLSSDSFQAYIIGTDSKSIEINLTDDEQVLLDNGLKCIAASITSYNSSTLTGIISVASSDFPLVSSGINGYKMIVNGELVVIESTSIDSSESSTMNFTAYVNSIPDVTSTPITGVQLMGFLDGQFDGWSAVTGSKQIEIFESSFRKPVLGTQGYGGVRNFICSRKTPGIKFSASQGYLFTSNVKITGYATIERPKTLTETINLDYCYNQLLVDGLYMMAERDSDASSSEALARTQIFEQSLRAYRVDMTAAAKRSAPRKFSSSPRLGAKNRGW